MISENYVNFLVYIIVHLKELLVELLKSEHYSRSGRSQENIHLVSGSVTEDPEMSIRRHSKIEPSR